MKKKIIQCESFGKIDWSGLSRPQKLSESFIEQFQDKVDWKVGWNKISSPKLS